MKRAFKRRVDVVRFKWTKVGPHFANRTLLEKLFHWFQGRWDPRRKL